MALDEPERPCLCPLLGGLCATGKAIISGSLDLAREPLEGKGES